MLLNFSLTFSNVSPMYYKADSIKLASASTLKHSTPHEFDISSTVLTTNSTFIHKPAILALFVADPYV